MEKLKIIKRATHRPTFICEICHCETPIEFEGGEPNTCADCMPIEEIVSNGARLNEIF